MMKSPEADHVIDHSSDDGGVSIGEWVLSAIVALTIGAIVYWIGA